MPQRPVGAPDLVRWAQVGADPCGDSLLPRVETRPGGDLPVSDENPGSVLEGPDPYHGRVKFDLCLLVDLQIEHGWITE